MAPHPPCGSSSSTFASRSGTSWSSAAIRPTCRRRFPDGYWPDTAAPPAGAWQRSVDGFLADRDAMIALIRDPQANLYRRIPHGTCQTLLREALVLADHNAYHVGQIVLLRRLLGCW